MFHSQMRDILAALYIVRDVERRGTLAAWPAHRRGDGRQHRHRPSHDRPGSGLSHHVGHPATQSQEKKNAIRLAGAELVEADAFPYTDRVNYVRYSERLAEELICKRAGRSDLGPGQTVVTILADHGLRYQALQHSMFDGAWPAAPPWL